MLGVGQAIFDIFYPVGSYYETSDTTFNPNTAHSWYGTWVEDTAGKVLVAQDTTQTEFDTVEETGGSKTVALNTNQMPTHSHEVRWGNNNGSYVSISADNSGTRSLDLGSWSWKNSQAASRLYTNVQGSGQAHNNLQPYIVIKRWHRTA